MGFASDTLWTCFLQFLDHETISIDDSVFTSPVCSFSPLQTIQFKVEEGEFLPNFSTAFTRYYNELRREAPTAKQNNDDKKQVLDEKEYNNPRSTSHMMRSILEKETQNNSDFFVKNDDAEERMMIISAKRKVVLSIGSGRLSSH